MFMTIAGFVILVLLFLLVAWLFVELGGLPGKKARERDHPQAEAIEVLGWLGLLLGGVGWVVALIWAYTKPPTIIVVQAPSPGPLVTASEGEPGEESSPPAAS